MELKQLVERLEEYAPLNTAKYCTFDSLKDVDNVGLLVEPTEPIVVKRVLVTNDLTEPVLNEALENKVNMIISYHPPIFVALKRFTQSKWKERSIVKCIENQIAIYSPHTTWDSIDGGINDWILDAFETTQRESVSEIFNETLACGFDKIIRINLSLDFFKTLLNQINNLNGQSVRFVSLKDIGQVGLNEAEFMSNDQGKVQLIEIITSIYGSNVLSTLRITSNEKPLMKNVGLGRLAKLKEPMKISDIVDRMKSYLNLKTFRLALGNGKTLDDLVSTLAIGAGCCSGLLNNTSAQFIITGEMSHHEILHEVHRGVSLIVTDHSKTERGYIDRFIKNFTSLLHKRNEYIELIKSRSDQDPLEYV